MTTQQNWHQRIGQVAYTRIGRPLMKSVAFIKEAKGEELIWKDKPGWIDGCLKHPGDYDIWIKNVKF